MHRVHLPLVQFVTAAVGITLLVVLTTPGCGDKPAAAAKSRTPGDPTHPELFFRGDTVKHKLQPHGSEMLVVAKRYVTTRDGAGYNAGWRYTLRGRTDENEIYTIECIEGELTLVTSAEDSPDSKEKLQVEDENTVKK